ncbi:hypothetical protein [Streptomyces sp. NPDC002133]|uniref:hypothetical protein n=1 Tax=Streptomyces sp. NPDC002133 TaxID=3154409 RepID=UPI003331A53C
MWEWFPEQRDEILALEREEAEYAELDEDGLVEVGAYTLASEIFVRRVLAPALDAVPMDAEIGARCATFIECLLGSQRPPIRELASLRITDHLLGYPENWANFREYSGELLLREVQERRPYYRGPFPCGN